MAFVPNKRNDIFISYATVDNGPEKRVKDFAKLFQSRLDQKLGRTDASKIWIDDKLRGSEPFDEQLEDEVHQSALFVIVMSNGWLNSDWCQREFKLFCASCNGDIRRRVIPIHFDGTDRSKWPSELERWSDLKFVFYSKQKITDVCMPLPMSFDLPPLYELREEVSDCLRLQQANTQHEKPIDIKSLNASYSEGLLEWQTSLTDGTWLERPELKRLIEVIEASNFSQQFIVGPPGSGKSSLLSKLAQALQDKEFEFLAIKADQLPKSVNNLRQLSREILKNDDLLVQRIVELADTTPVVVIIDQLDALAELVDLNPGRLNAVIDFIAAIRGLNNLHLVVSSRPHELKVDLRLQNLVNRESKGQVEVIQLDNLPRVNVVEQLKKNDIDSSNWPLDFLSILEVPYRLYVFLKTMASSGGGVSQTEPQLFKSLNSAHHVYWEVTVGKRSEKHREYLEQLARKISNDELLWQSVDEKTDAGILKDLEEDGWITVTEKKVGFAHQTQYEYVVARTFASKPSAFLTHVVEHQHGLSVRPTVRLTLMFMRDIHCEDYIYTFSRLLTVIERRHLKQLLVEFLANVEKPTPSEIRWVVEYLKAPETHDSMCFLLRGKQDWFDALLGHFPALMCQPDLNRWPMTRLLESAWEFADTKVTSLLRDNWAYQAEYHQQLWIVCVAGPSDRETTTWLLWIASNFPLGDWPKRDLTNAMRISRPRDAVLILGRLLMRRLESQLSESIENLYDEPKFYEFNKPLQKSNSGITSELSDREWYDVDELVNAAGHEHFLNSVWPWFKTLMEACKPSGQSRLDTFRSEREGWRWLLHDRFPESQLIRAIEDSVLHLAIELDKFEAFLVENSHLNSVTIQRILLRGMTAVASKRPDLVLSFFAIDCRRLFLGHSMSGQEETLELLDKVIPYWTEGQIVEFETLVLNWQPYRSDEDAGDDTNE